MNDDEKICYAFRANGLNQTERSFLCVNNIPNIKKFMASCIAIIDKDKSLLYIKTAAETEPDDELKLHYTVYSSLDVVEERLIQPSSSRGSDLRELYLGLLLSTEEYRVFGFATNSKIKFILLVELSNATLKDQEIRTIFRRLHNAYCNIVANPFFIPNQPLCSQSLDEIASELLSKKI